MDTSSWLCDTHQRLSTPKAKDIINFWAMIVVIRDVAVSVYMKPEGNS